MSGRTYYQQQRYYDPVAARFLSVDPVTTDAETGAMFDRYMYANNNPYRYTDPDGRQACSGASCADGLPQGLFQAGAATAPAPIQLPTVTITAPRGGVSPSVNPGAAIPLIRPIAPWMLLFIPSPLGAPACEMLGGPSCGGMRSQAATSPVINPSDVAGKTPGQIDQLATGAGLKPKGPDPQNGRGAYVDPVTGEQRILIHGDHAHVNDAAGNRLDVNGNVVPSNFPAAHLPVGTP